MATPDGVIDSTNLCSQSVTERILGDSSVTSLKIFNTLQSDNFSSGSAGWQINRVTGSAEFQDVTVRGSLNADDISAGTMAASFIGAGTIGVHIIKLSNSSSSRIESNDGTSLIIRGDGTLVATSATISGAITATSGTLSTLSVDGTLTLVSGGLFRTAASGQRIQMGLGSAFMSVFDAGGTVGTVGETGGDFLIASAAGSQLIIDSVDSSVFIGVASDTQWELDPTANVIIGFAGGTEKLRVTTTGIESAQTTGAAHIRSAAGAEATPTYAFFGDLDTGMYRIGANNLGFAIGGSGQWQIDTSGRWRNEAGTAGTALLPQSVSASSPAYGFTDDTNTGMHRGAADTVQLVAGGTVQLSCTTSFFTAQRVYTETTADAVNVTVNSGGTIRRSTSAAKYKTNIETAAWLADVPLRPVEYDSLLDDRRHYFGLVADDVAAALPDAGTYHDGEVENYDQRAVIAVLAAKINRLEEAARGT